MHAIGRGQTGVETFCAVMHLPKPSHRSQYYNKVISKTDKVADESMKTAALDAVTDNKGSSDICGGTWQKRGGTPLNLSLIHI